MNHDVIAIAASAGGVEVLVPLVRELPTDLPASLFVAMHVSPAYPSLLPDMLSDGGRLRCHHPLHHERIEPGHIYVAPPDNHLIVRAGYMEVVRGPKENGHRPAADALFRSAATAYGPRVVGVVLSGMQTCGTAGMMSIKARGGISVVQAPDTALAAEMPRSVIDRVRVDYVVDPRELPALLVDLARTPAAGARDPDRTVAAVEGTTPGTPAELVCPVCQGVLRETRAGAFAHFRCHVGHAFSLESLVSEQAESLERAMWAAVRSLEESAALSERLAAVQTGDMQRRFTEKGRTQRAHADAIRNLLLYGRELSAGDAAAVE